VTINTITLCLTLTLATAPALAAGDEPSPFTEESVARGIDFHTDQPVPFGDGASFADLDGDGDADILLTGRADGVLGLYENDGNGHFTDKFPDCGLDLLPKAKGVIAGDYDNDGDLDLFVSRWGQSNGLFRNDGGFHFTDVTQEAGLLGDTGQGAGCAWGDVNGDGWLDLYVSNHDGPNLFYLNTGGAFEEMAAAMGIDADGQLTFQATFLDYDLDGDADLYLANSYGQHCDKLPNRNFLYRNDDGLFTDVTEESGTEACVDSMCIGVGDFDGNGYPDIYVTDNNVPGNVLLLNNGDGTFLEDAATAGVESFETAWGSVFFDYDNDGLLELYVCNMSRPNRLYRHDGAWPCEDIGPQLGVDTPGGSFSIATADVDADGDLDLLLSNRNDMVRLFINHEGEKRRWAEFDVVGTGITRYAIGAVVHVRTDDVTRIRELIAGDGYMSQQHLLLHFGLGEAPGMDEVIVRWPGGISRTLTGLAIDQRWTLYPPDRLGDADGDGDRDLDDFVRFATCHGSDAPGTIQPGCEVMDYEGDGDVDDADFAMFLADFDGPQDDCNKNGVMDLQEILDGSAPDVNGNGVIDGCEFVAADLNGDFLVNDQDLQILIAAWGQPKSPADLDGDGSVGMSDLMILLASWD